MQLFLNRLRAVRGLLLVGPEPPQLALLREHAFHSIRPYRPRQLVLKVTHAGVEADPLELAAVVAPQRAQEVPLLPHIVEAGKSEVVVLPQEARQVPVAAHRHDGDALGSEVTATAARKRLDCAAVARTLDEHHSAQLHARIRSGRSDWRRRVFWESVGATTTEPRGIGNHWPRPPLPSVACRLVMAGRPRQCPSSALTCSGESRSSSWIGPFGRHPRDGACVKRWRPTPRWSAPTTCRRSYSA